jgi:hypothetical protein
MVKHGFVKHNQIALLQKVFVAICGSNKVRETDQN